MLRNVVTNVMGFIKKRQSAFIQPCDGRILKMHHQYTLWICLFLFCTVWHSWYNKDPLICVNKFNADAQVRMDILNLCLSYGTFNDPTSKDVKIMMFYKWIPFSIMIIGAMFYIPRKLSKHFESNQLVRLMTMLSQKSGNETVRETIHHFMNTRKYFNSLFYKYLFCNVVALGINILCMFTLDFFLQGRFLSYGLIDVYNREVQNFTDDVSRTFPPFTQCQITPQMRLIAGRTDRFGCHLTLMEVYEKLFFIIWWWMVFLMVTTGAYIVFLVSFRLCSKVQLLALRSSKPDALRKKFDDSRFTETLKKLLTKVEIGEIYSLYRLKEFFSPAQYFELIMKLEKEFSDAEEIEEKKEKSILFYTD